MTRIVSEIKAICIGAIDAVFQIALIVIPANEMDSVREIGARCSPATGFPLVTIPRAVQRLGIAIGAGSPLPRYDPENLGPWRAGIGLEAGFGIDCGHQNRNRHAEFARNPRGSRLPVIEPTVALIEDRTHIVDLPWGSRAAS